jgi:hypothetical protein
LRVSTQAQRDLSFPRKLFPPFFVPFVAFCSNPHLISLLSSECVGSARNSAKVVDQVRFLARAFFAVTLEKALPLTQLIKVRGRRSKYFFPLSPQGRVWSFEPTGGRFFRSPSPVPAKFPLVTRRLAVYHGIND